MADARARTNVSSLTSVTLPAMSRSASTDTTRSKYDSGCQGVSIKQIPAESLTHFNCMSPLVIII